jgi:flagellar biosynthesis protein FliQ
MIILLPWMLNLFMARIQEMFAYIPNMIH